MDLNNCRGIILYMNQVETPTNNISKEIIFKGLVKFKDRFPNRVYLSNKISPDDVKFIRKYLGYDTEIAFFEHTIPKCPYCDSTMSKNGTKSAKPNKMENTRLQQYICPHCKHEHVTSLNDHKKPHANYTYTICQKALEYELISYMSFEKKAEIIANETGIVLKRQTVCYHQYAFCEEFLDNQEQLINQLIKTLGIEPSGVYCYDEEFLGNQKDPQVRLTIIDAVTNQIINDQTIKKEDFTPDFIEIFLKYTLKNLPKKLLITDGHPSYPSIIEKICIDHQLCIFHIIKNQRDPIFKKMNKLKRTEKNTNKKIEKNNREIEELKKYGEGKPGRKAKKDKKGTHKNEKKKDLNQENKNLRKQRSETNKEFKTHEYNNERISNIYNAETEEQALRRFHTIYNQKDNLDDDLRKFLEKLEKKFDKTITFYKNEIFPKTNNKIEGYFKITLPKHLKKKFRTIDGLKLKIRLNKIRWNWRNVLNMKHKNFTILDYNFTDQKLISC